nr:immunoglobulin heavy chain junction region [Macaca mulatta]MOV49397.1 immunoglobulin heavy chain junction region [Macaca mulatta]MOV50360.1 immunoglobulin heavy chain junction region [Macaca mulatta]MOV50591.1 immunoglobulin heavy chain junction region [Macaca mulatta]MOV50985.1 immunoglobulin heavy chain junction region [Macaca mulatta]
CVREGEQGETAATGDYW